MEVVRPPDQPPHGALVLAGPAPRASDVPSWRDTALEVLRARRFAGVVVVPEPRQGTPFEDSDARFEWEHQSFAAARAIAFWVPRQLECLPGFTTNVEFGMWYASGRTVLGFPRGAPHMAFLEFHARRVGAPVRYTLDETLGVALELLVAPQRSRANKKSPKP